jgi:hypothetical protein
MRFGVRLIGQLKRRPTPEAGPDSCPEVLFWSITVFGRSCCGICPRSRFRANDAAEQWVKEGKQAVNVTIDGNINQHVTADITSVNGAINIGQKVNDTCIASLTAGTTVNIGLKFDQHSEVTVVAQGDVTINQKIDQLTVATITSVNGSINIGQGLSGFATATLIAVNGSINIGDSVDGGSTVNWNAQHFNCPHQDGTINHI